MPRKYIARLAAERNLCLNNYSGEEGATVWCWEDSDTHEASQEFTSEEAALDALRKERLEWTYVNDDGYVMPSLTEADDSEDEPDDDEELDVTEAGELLAELHWDPGGPGAGAGVVRMYGYNEKLYVSHDAGVDE